MSKEKGSNRWEYEFSCKKCAMTAEIHDEIRDGVYCVPAIEGKRTIHADDDFRVRCDCFKEIV